MTLRLDWCSHKAAKAACERWHYSRTMPVAKTVSIGVWEDGAFIGAVLFSWGANPNIGKPYGLEMTEVAELVRVALTNHAAPTSRIIAIAIRLLSAKSPGLRLLVSYADTEQGHHGGIYQAGNWLYAGCTSKKVDYWVGDRKLQRRAYTGQNFGKGRLPLPSGAVMRESPPKHRYLMPLDPEMRARIEPLRKPYPKRPKHSSDAAGHQLAEGGAEPTRTLQESEAERA